MIKKIGLGLLGLLVLFILFNLQHLVYGINQLKGQLSIIWGSEEVEVVLQSDGIHDSIRAKLMLIQEIREFGFEELGLTRNSNYTTYYDQGGQAVLWVLTACPEFSLEPYTWNFPLFGGFPYKGYFDFEKGKKEANMMRKSGYDVDLSPVEGWSTLGFFSDPVLSNMLQRDEGGLANLILHELFHGTLFIRDSVQFNENLANFVGDKGARLFLTKRFGRNSSQLQNYAEEQGLRLRFSEFMVQMAPILDSTYKAMDTTQSVTTKRKIKMLTLDRIMNDWRLIANIDSTAFVNKDWEWNNTLFADFLRYNSQREILEDELVSQFNGSLHKMIEAYKERN